MTREDILDFLKTDLQISVPELDRYLASLIATATELIRAEGIELTDSIADGELIEMYAAYLYRQRKGDIKEMPRALRYALNNRLFTQKGGA